MSWSYGFVLKGLSNRKLKFVHNTYPQIKVHRNVNLSNLEHVLQRNPRTGRVQEYIFRASGGTNFLAQHKPWWV